MLKKISIPKSGSTQQSISIFDKIMGILRHEKDSLTHALFYLTTPPSTSI